ncbi:helix-turn-helix domain-containing protein [Rothia sp. AR01]|uniref:Helix-turn-helix domain-containing protein n=1 Tax=Rothia santali TaxID=2949643 RepID=A0A9X2KM89_9MICC|nr:PucR family transcriptional regulator [Rothia santali]MCP3426941.1 helix-turn-helix domain-containing protein [Rothia santali]
MELNDSPVKFTDLLPVFGPGVRLIHDGRPCFDPEILTSRQWNPNEPFPESSCLLILDHGAEASSALRDSLSDMAPHAWVLINWPEDDVEPLTRLGESGHLVAIAPAGTDAVDIIVHVDRATRPASESELRRLTSMQRRFSQSLTTETPIQSILDRLHKTTQAVAVIVNLHGRALENTGTVPLSLIFEQIRQTTAPSQMIAIDGWHGLAVRLHAGDDSMQPTGWLVNATRRTDFPSADSLAAAHIAATLIETSLRMTSQARSQETAIRTSLFEQALSFRPELESPELASKFAAADISLSHPLRVLVATPVNLRAHGSSRDTIRELHADLIESLSEFDIPFFSTFRDEGIAFLIQAEGDSIRRFLRIPQEDAERALYGIGRNVNNIGEVAASYADAWLAIRALRSQARPKSQMAIEQFDFATRLFASIGIEKMTELAQDFLSPLIEREPVLLGLRRYFEHKQNTKAAAASLGIHHNSLRYRLSKVEEILQLDLNEPTAIASLHLALTALDLGVSEEAPGRSRRRGDHQNTTGRRAPERRSSFPGPRPDEPFGVSFHPSSTGDYPS